ncbi:unnamed protein product [marine sediment metagenome]|uniref:Helix-turn-helix domain-containing protein n=1 Tax=marine sediment metagenome TaxID=412755 RepID=X0U337_9ZZZZ
MSDFYTAKEVGGKISMKTRTVKKWAREGKIPHSKIGGEWRFNKIQIDKWIKNREGVYVETKDKE